MSQTQSFLSRRCRYCGQTFTAQQAEFGPKVPMLDADFVWRRRAEKLVDYVPAYMVRQLHERDACPQRPEAVEK